MIDYRIELNLLSFQSLVTFEKRDGVIWIFDPVRKRYFISTPEEVVRQLVIQYLIHEKNYRKNLIAVEKMLIINELKKRFDILIMDSEHKPFLMIECKAPHIPISQETFHQVATYNIPLQVKYLMVTNGLISFCCKMDYEKRTFDFLKEVPPFPEAFS